MLTIKLSSKFKKDIKLLEKRGKNLEKLKNLLVLLKQQEKLPEFYKDHALKGEWALFRDAHVEPDWILIYRVAETELFLARTGSHADLFKN